MHIKCKVISQSFDKKERKYVMNQGASKKRPLRELQARSKLALREDLIEIARTNSPSVSYDLALAETNNLKIAQATRWLAILRRDYGKTEFLAFTQAEK